MKRKFTLILLMLIAIFTFAFVLSSCQRHECFFVEQRIEDEYRASDATCTEAEKYYYSCACGKKGDKTFEWGSERMHSWSDVYQPNNDGTHTRLCNYNMHILVEDCSGGSPNADGKARCKHCWRYYDFFSPLQKTTEGLSYELNQDGTGYVVTGGEGIPGFTNLVIPSEYEGLPVVGIGDRAFSSYPITNLVIPDSIVSIGNYAFEFCNNLENIFMGKGVEQTGSYSFRSLDNLISVYYAGTIEQWVEIDFGTCDSNPISHAENFYVNNEIVSQVSITQSSKISDLAFQEYKKLTKITIGENVKYIGSLAFYDCVNLKDVYYTGTVDQWAQIVFGNSEYSNPLCYAENFYIDNQLLTEANLNVPHISSMAFRKYEKLLKVTIGDNVLSMGHSVFKGCKNLNAVTLGGNLETIGGSTFSECSSLKEIDFPNKIKHIGSSAFTNCESLTKIYIPENVETIENYAFFNCTNLGEVIIGSGVTTIGSWSFKNCAKLSSLSIENSKAKIGESAFANCTSLTELFIPDSITSIGDNAFTNCKSLINVVIGNGVTDVGSRAFNNCKSLTDLTIGCGIEQFGYIVFYGCEKLTNVYYLGTIDQWAQMVYFFSSDPHILSNAENFYVDNELVTQVTLTTATRISDYAFAGYDRLTKITIPETVQSIGYSAFEGCDGLTQIFIPKSVSVIRSTSFCYCKNLTEILVDENNQDYKSIDGDLYSKDGTILYEYALGKKNAVFVVPDSVTIIENYAFEGCTGLTQIEISKNVEHIGKDVFNGCINLQKVIIPKSVTKFDSRAFYCCISLEKIEYDGTIEEWNRIKKGYAWNAETSIIEVICSDGVIMLTYER